jgi:hypothetical protein
MFFRLEGPLEQTRARPHTDIAASSQERAVRTQGSRHIQRKKGGMCRSECGECVGTSSSGARLSGERAGSDSDDAEADPRPNVPRCVSW